MSTRRRPAASVETASFDYDLHGTPYLFVVVFDSAHVTLSACGVRAPCIRCGGRSASSWSPTPSAYGRPPVTIIMLIAVRLTRAAEAITQVFEISGFTALFPKFDDRDAA